jgi:hypothetical protein
MEDKIYDIITDFIRDDITKDKAIEQLLVLCDVVSTLNHDDLSVGEQVRITQTKLVKINCFREDGDIDVEDTTSVFTVGINEISKVV